MNAFSLSTVDELGRMREIWRAFLDAAPAGVAIFDRDMRYIEASARWKQDYGLGDRDIVGLGHYEVFPEIPDRWREIHRRCLAGATERADAEPFPRADGTTDWVRWEIRPWHLSDGAIGGIIILSEVVTERIRAENTLREQEARFRGLVEQQVSGVVIVRQDGTLAYANMYFGILAGCSPAQLVGRPLLDLVPPEEHHAVMSHLSQQFSGGLSGRFVQMESKMVSQTGEVRDILVNATRSEYEGQPASTAVVLDITDRKRAEGALEISERRFSTIFDHSPAGIAITDLEHRGSIADVNRAFLDMMRFQREEVIGRNAVELNLWIDPARRDAMYAEMNGPSGLSSGDVQFRAKTGEVVDVALTLRKIELGGRPFAIALVHDVTQRLRAQRAARRMNRALRTLSAGNEAVVRATDEQSLLDAMCLAVVDQGGYKAAGIRFAENDDDKTLRLVAFAGVDREVLSATNLTWADGPLGQGPSGFAIRTGQVQVNQDYVNYPKPAPWMGTLIRAGIAGNIALPLKNDKGVFGVLIIYTTEVKAFGPEEVSLLIELANDLAFGIVALRDRKERAAQETRMREGMRGTIGALAQTMETRDTYTAGHQRRVADLAVAIAGRMGLPADRIEGIYFAGMLHDIGKISVPAEFLSKPSRLSAAEFEVIKGHVQASYDILKGVTFPWPVAEIAYQHHERLDGSGYPRGLKADAILLEAKILSVADVTESMISHRPYRPARGIDAALAEIESGKGKLYDPTVADACIALMRDGGFTFS